ncbi:hypothetical protein AVEN_181582-1 [Araneus ventricosus]|uniref:Mos1 transposase HTH domain-containing protein n=1 Tax=Araneus ventricosus TaxID=182803 RepID=A0A4Y2E457_ARAVE|nr:hypothetical protein AVEN_181582-1 [Araneus ventricosus]
MECSAKLDIQRVPKSITPSGLPWELYRSTSIPIANVKKLVNTGVEGSGKFYIQRVSISITPSGLPRHRCGWSRATVSTPPSAFKTGPLISCPSLISTHALSPYRTVFAFVIGLKPKEIKPEWGEVHGTSAPAFATVYNWLNEFKRGHTSTNDGNLSGRPEEVTSSEKIDKIHDMVLSHRRIKVREIVEATGIKVQRFQFCTKNWV